MQPMTNLRRKRQVEETEKGEIGREKARPQKKGKETKKPRDKRTRSTDTRDEAATRREQRTWSPRIELDGVSIPWDATLWEFQREQASYLADALQQPLLLPRDMEGLRKTRQPELFMSLKRDMAMVSRIFYLVPYCAPYYCHVLIRFYLLLGAGHSTNFCCEGMGQEGSRGLA